MGLLRASTHREAPPCHGTPRYTPPSSASCRRCAPRRRANLALLVGAILARRTINLTALAGGYPRPAVRRIERPKHDLLHRLKRRWRFVGNAQLDALALQAAFIPHTVAALGRPRRLGLASDWPMCDARLIDGTSRRDQVLRALPPGVVPVVPADRGFARAPFFAWLQRHGAAFVVRVTTGTCLIEAGGTRWTLGQRDPARGRLAWHPAVRYGLHHGRPRDVTVNLAQCWRLPRHQARARRRAPPGEPWYLATDLAGLEQAAAWYRHRGWIEQSFKDTKSRFGLANVLVGCPQRLSCLLAALTAVLAWLARRRRRLGPPQRHQPRPRPPRRPGPHRLSQQRVGMRHPELCAGTRVPSVQEHRAG